MILHQTSLLLKEGFRKVARAQDLDSFKQFSYGQLPCNTMGSVTGELNMGINWTLDKILRERQDEVEGAFMGLWQASAQPITEVAGEFSSRGVPSTTVVLPSSHRHILLWARREPRRLHGFQVHELHSMCNEREWRIEHSEPMGGETVIEYRVVATRNKGVLRRSYDWLWFEDLLNVWRDIPGHEILRWRWVFTKTT